MPLTKIQSLGITDGTIVNADINASAAIAGTKLTGVGKILQVVSAVFNTTTSNASNAFVATGLSGSITPSSASNKVLILIQVGACGGSPSTAFRIFKDGSHLTGASGTAVSNRIAVAFRSLAVQADDAHAASCSFAYLDSPATTSSTTYALHFLNQSTFTSHINRDGTNNDTALSYGSRTASTITLMEIAA
jgi:hypothetical protein